MSPHPHINPALWGLYTFITGMVGLVILFGGNFPLAQSLTAVLAAVFLSSSRFSASNAPINPKYNRILWATGISLTLTLIWVAIQLIPIPTNTAWQSPFWSITPVPSSWSSISMAPTTTLHSLIYICGLAGCAWGVYRRSHLQPLIFVKSLSILITLVGIYGIITYAIGNTMVLWLSKTDYFQAISGTFINPDTFATLCGLGILANLALILLRIGEISSRLTPRQRFKVFWYLVLQPNWPWAIGLIINTITLIQTGSLTAMAATLFAVFVMLGSLAGARPAVRWFIIALIGGIVISATSLFILVGGQNSQHADSVLNKDYIHSTISQASSHLINSYWLTGTGLGTFPQALATTRDPETFANITYYIDHAYNTYLELFIELGLPGTIFISIALAGLLIIYVLGLSVRRTGIAWPALGLGTLALLGSNALTDFSLSIPAVALTGLTLLMVALAQSLPSQEKPTSLTRSIAVWIVCAAIFITATVMSWANYHALKAESTLRNIANQIPTGQNAILTARQHLIKCNNINPLNPNCNNNLATINLTLADDYGLSGRQAGVSMVYLHTAHNNYLKSLQYSPANSLAWFRVALIEAHFDNNLSAVKSMANSLLTDPTEPSVFLQRVPLMLKLMPHANEDNQTLFTANILSLWQTVPHLVASEVRRNQAVQPEFAKLLGNSAQTREEWKRYVKTPFPASAPLGGNNKKD